MRNLLFFVVFFLFNLFFSVSLVFPNIEVFDEAQFKKLGYVNCNPRSNGESLFVNEMVKDRMTIFDIGANEGAWTDLVLEAQCDSVEMHLFEPIPRMCDLLKKKYSSNSIKVNTLALSSKEGLVDFYVYDYTMYSGFYDRKVLRGYHKNKVIVNSTTIDRYCILNRINHVDLLKIDAEGAEWDILKGAEMMLRANMIRTVYFEYGGCNVDSGTTLFQIYNHLKSLNYNVYRLSPIGLLHIKNWQKRLENYKYSNYVAIKNDDS